MSFHSSTFNSDILRFGVKLGLFGVLSVAAWFAIVFAAGAPHAPEMLSVIEQVERDHPEVVYFGDSTAASIAPFDADRRNIPDKLRDQLAGPSVGAIHSAAFNLDVYALVAHRLRENDALPKLFVVPINLRSFSPLWYSRPEWQFPALKLHLRNDSFLFHALYQPLAVFHAFNLEPISRERYAEEIAAFADDGAGGQRSIMALMYNYELNDGHPLFNRMEALVEDARSAGGQVLFYITPIDYALGTQQGGPSFLNQVEENIGVIEGTANRLDAPLIDLSLTLPTERFTHDGGLNEHLDEVGRRFVVEAISAHIEQFRLLR